jgi:hypothetical protein
LANPLVRDCAASSRLNPDNSIVLPILKGIPFLSFKSDGVTTPKRQNVICLYFGLSAR